MASRKPAVALTRQHAISWTEATWNPWMGCTKVSEGCDNCYMFREQRQYGNDPEVVRRSKTKFRFPLTLKEPSLIFTCSWSDWFHVDADPWRDEAWEIVRATPQHTYQILTKRPGRILRHLPADWGDGRRARPARSARRDADVSRQQLRRRALTAAVQEHDGEPSERGEGRRRSARG